MLELELLSVKTDGWWVHGAGEFVTDSPWDKDGNN